MGEPTADDRPITILDAAAIVTGGAVASYHFRDLNEEMARLPAIGWVVLLLPFAWLGLTAAGPFVFVVRRFGRRPKGYPAADDRLWLALGLPWVIAACYRSAVGMVLGDAPSTLYEAGLFGGLAATSFLALRQLSRSWARLEPGSAGRPIPAEPLARTWTEWIGRVLTLTWPVQLGLGFVVTK